MTLWLQLAAPAAALAACVAALLLWRAASAQGKAMARLDSRLDEMSLALDRAKAVRRDEALLEAIRALRDDLTILCTHVSSLTDGELETKKLVEAAVAREIETLSARLDESDAGAGRRAAALRDRVEYAIDRIEERTSPARAPDATPLERLGRIEALLCSLSAPEPPHAPVPSPDAEPDPEPKPARPRGVDFAADPAPAVEIAPAAEAETAPPPRRAPAAFNSGRVASVIPARRG